MPEIFLGGRQFSFEGLKTSGPKSLSEFGFEAKEIGKHSETLFNRGVEVVLFMNKVASDRVGRVPTTQFFWVGNKGDSETVFVKTPLGASEENTKSALLMLHTNSELRKYIQRQFAESASRKKMRELISALIQASGKHIDESNIFVSTIGYIEKAANSMILDATRQLTRPFDILTGMQHARDISITHLPHDKPINEAYEYPSITDDSSHIHIEPPKLEPSRYYMNKKQVIELSTEDEEALQRIDALTAGRHAGGKFRGQVVMHGVSLTEPKYNLNGSQDYEMFPGGGMPYRYIEKVDPTKRVSGFLEVNYQAASSERRGMKQMFRKTPEGLDFFDSLNIAYIKDPQGKDTTHVFIQSPNADRDRASRETFFLILSCEMPNEVFRHLRELIRKNPENAERFLQVSFAGIDDSTWRIATDRVSLVDIDKYIPMSILGGPKITGNIDFTLGEFAKKKMLDLSAVETYKYSRNLPELK